MPSSRERCQHRIYASLIHLTLLDDRLSIFAEHDNGTNALEQFRQENTSADIKRNALRVQIQQGDVIRIVDGNQIGLTSADVGSYTILGVVRKEGIETGCVGENGRAIFHNQSQSAVATSIGAVALAECRIVISGIRLFDRGRQRIVYAFIIRSLRLWQDHEDVFGVE